MKFTILLICLLLTNGCALLRPVQVIQPAIYKPVLPAKLQLRSVEWQLVNEGTNVSFSLDAENYENLSKNMIDITAYIHEMRVIVWSFQQTNFSK